MVLEGDQRTPLTSWKPAVVIVELNAFENVRTVAGHLSAERMAADAVARLRMLLRAGDRLHQLGDDRFGIVVGVTDPNQVEALCRRVAAALEELPVPKRAADVRPLIRSAIAAQIAADPELAALVADFQPAQLRRAG
jgi:GGDEF domain-containing protein